MKKLTYFAAALIFFSACSKDEDDDVIVRGPADTVETEYEAMYSIDPEKRFEPFVGIVSATSCGECGRSGHPNFDEFVAEQTDINGVAFHYSNSDVMSNQWGYEFAQTIQLTSTPTYTTGLRKFPGQNGSWRSHTGAQKNNDATYYIGIEADAMGDSLSVTIHGYKNLDMVAGTQVALYVLENNFITGQTDYSASPSWVEDYLHNHVLRQAPFGTFGAELNQDQLSTDEWSVSTALKLNQSIENTELVVVLYQEIGGEYVVGNSQKLSL